MYALTQLFVLGSELHHAHACRAGLETKLACKVDRSCIETIRTNRPDLPLLGNIYDYTCSEIKKAAGLRKNQRPLLISGGAPCQTFSTAGKRGSINDPRGNLLMYFIDLAMEIQPTLAALRKKRDSEIWY